MSAGYVYVIAFSDGMVKVGRSVNAARRIKDHEIDARRFGTAVAERWESVRHVGWIENEGELKRFARELGGEVIGEEYFKNIRFDALVAKAEGLTFLKPSTATLPGRGKQGHVRSLHLALRLLDGSIRRHAHGHIPAGECTREQSIRTLVDLVLLNEDVAALLIRDLVETRLDFELRGAEILRRQEGAA